MSIKDLEGRGGAASAALAESELRVHAVGSRGWLQGFLAIFCWEKSAGSADMVYNIMAAKFYPHGTTCEVRGAVTIRTCAGGFVST